jgi:predicted ATPase
VDAYLDLEFPENRFPNELSSLIHAKTEGSPLFMADVIRYLRDRGVIVKQNGSWALAQSLPNIDHDLPESIRSMIQRKMDQLADTDRRLLAAASVQGHEFNPAVVAKALEMDAAQVEERLEALDRIYSFVRMSGEREFPDSSLTLRYSFVHVLYQNAFYAGLTATRKASLSAAVARALVAFYGEQSSEVAAELALLFEVARDFTSASDYFVIAAKNTAAVAANQEAIALIQRSIACATRLRGEARTFGWKLQPLNLRASMTTFRASRSQPRRSTSRRKRSRKAATPKRAFKRFAERPTRSF